ncbi:FecR family protein [Methylobacter tundripaludum]|uniref:FecR family protein n=1 Tax=Methylobacter tundripaludum TaxID=173365 RepID=UPI0004DF0397|nr:FecR family protein [Methylobacter tundripaludum]
MPSTQPSSPKQSASDQATAWFARLHADDVTAAEQEQFKSWYRESQQHAQAYDKMLLLWDRLEAPGKRVNARVEAEQPALAHRPVPGKQPYIRRLMAASALALVVLLSYQLPVHYQNWQSDYYTAPGKQLTVVLNDGSRLTLNTDTALAVNLSDSQRSIELLRGEAYFQVSPDKNRPFIVSNGIAKARAVGTAFSVKKTDEDMQVIVSEGTVEVSAGKTDAPTLVHINQQVDYQQGRVGPVIPTDILETLAWQRGQLIFKRQPLARVITEVNRYRSGQIMIINPKLKERVVSGVFDTADPNAVVDGVKTTLKVSSMNLSNQLVLLY